jgi:hypothetical protein
LRYSPTVGRRARAAIIAAALLCSLRIDAAPSRRVFALTQLDGPIQSLLDHPDIDGIALQIGWPALEPAERVYRWSELDAVLAQIMSRQKEVTLHVLPDISPWLKAAGARTYSFVDFQGHAREAIVPWDETYLARFTEFLSALHEHLRDSGSLQTVGHVSVAAPVPEMDLAGCRNELLGSSVRFDRAIYLLAWKRMVDAYAAAFPAIEKLVSAPVGLICFPQRDALFYRDVMDHAAQTGEAFLPFAADLTSEGSDRMASYNDLAQQYGVAFQTIWSATNDPGNRMKGHYPDNLRAAVCTALRHNAMTIEIYAADVLNDDPAIQSAIHAFEDASTCTTPRRRAVRR